MGATIQILLALLGVVPSILSTVTALEQQTAGAPKAGPDKLVAAVNIVGAGLETVVPDVVAKLPAGKVTDFITRVVNEAVSLMNKLGLFKKSS